jgi:uncharacterized membrane protein
VPADAAWPCLESRCWGSNRAMSSTQHGKPGVISAPPSKASGLLYGVGFGGFIDGIVFHQILQWHHLVSHVDGYPVTTVAGLEANMLADGFFHVVTWCVVFAGSITAIAAWRGGRPGPNWRFHIGLLLAGWGIFNTVEGVINHQILGVHHVRDDLGAPISWDIGFLIFGAVLIIAGWLLHRRGVRALEPVSGTER